MKELSIEEKAKRYDELKVKAQGLEEDGCFDKITLFDLFPELKESEDEKIKQLLLRFVKYDMSDNYSDDFTPADCVAWLEKQGEQKPTDKIEPKFKVGHTIKKEGFNLGFTIAKIEDGFYYNDEGDYFPFTDQDNWKLVEQKPAWSEEDEMFVHGLIRGLSAKKDIHGHTTFSSDCIDITETINWLKSIKDRVLPKVEWSEEEEENFKKAIRVLKVNNFHHTADMLQEMKYKLIPREKANWKPSDEQMKTLQEVIDVGYFTSYPNSLETLYEQLKKLKGE